MGRSSRNRKPGRREPNGRPQRPSIAERADFAKDMENIERRTVLAQPHRMGSMDQGCASALGRFVILYELEREVLDAAEAYAGLVRRWRAAKGVPVSTRVTAMGGGDGPSDAAVRGWGKEIARIETEVSWRNQAGYPAMRALILDDADQPPAFHAACKHALRSLAILMGYQQRKPHPFNPGLTMPAVQASCQ